MARTIIVPFFLLLHSISLESYELKNQTAVPCSSHYENAPSYETNRCYPRGGNCRRILLSNFISRNQIEDLKKIADKGIDVVSSPGSVFHSVGPTIVDINSGYVRGPRATEPINMYEVVGKKGGIDAAMELFTEEEISLYNSTLQSVRMLIEEKFGVSDVYFTGPTFITRIIGGDTLTEGGESIRFWSVFGQSEKMNEREGRVRHLCDCLFVAAFVVASLLINLPYGSRSRSSTRSVLAPTC